MIYPSIILATATPITRIIIGSCIKAVKERGLPSGGLHVLQPSSAKQSRVEPLKV